MRKIKFILVFSVSSLLLACGQPGGSTHESSNTESSQEGPGGGSAQSVCFSSGSCFPVVSSGDLADPGRDYQYPDPNKFPTQSLRPQYARPIGFIDLKDIDLNQKVSPNFVASEFVSERKGRYGILSRGMVAKLQQIRTRLGRALVIHSGYRSPGYNSDIDGSATWSRHTYGDAVDMHASGASLKALRTQCQRANASFYLLYKTHIHCDWRTLKLDSAFYKTTSVAPTGERVTRLDPYFITGGYIYAQPLSESEVLLSVEDFHIEEPGELLYEWKVLMPDGQEQVFDTPTVVIPKVEGSTRVTVEVGGSVVLEKLVTW